jgi:hypothetical protein
LSSTSRSSIFLTAVTIIIIVFAMVIITEVEKKSSSSSNMITVVGPVWNNATWTCTSNNDFIVHGALRGLPTSQIAIGISGIGTQSLYQLNPGYLESFSVGSPAGHTMSITSTGTVTGFLTLQTKAGSTANCTQ